MAKFTNKGLDHNGIIMSMISDNLQQVRTQIQTACAVYGRNPDAITLLAVSKTWGAQAVREAYAVGQRAFGENYIQEGVEKIADLADLADIEWHMIGPVQSNKTRLVAAHFSWVHSVHQLKTAERLSQQRPSHLPDLQVCIQVNLEGTANKSGLAPGQVRALAQALVQLPRLRLRGIMVIPEVAPNLEAASALFKKARGVFDEIKGDFEGIDTLSMGMSADMPAAIREGSTLLRVGTAIFGRRM